MMVGQRTRKCREYRGPAPASVAIRARPIPKVPPDYLILKNREKEDSIRERKELEMKQRLTDLKSEWERFTDKKIMLTTLNREVSKRIQTHDFGLEARRERLRNMLRKEEQEYTLAMVEAEETVLERQAKMRERAKQLKDKREDERLKFVQDKYDQQFREQCEELRSTLSKREQDLVCAERQEQLKQKEELDKERKAYDDLYADLWEKDRLEKVAREEREAKDAHERNREMLDVLSTQKAALETQKEEARRLKEEEQQLMKEQAALRKLEEEAAAEEKRRRQQEMRDMLDTSLKMKLRKKAKEEQEQLAFDLKMLEQLLEQSRNEAREQLQRKMELREEDRRYREYLARLLEEEKAKERELERLIQQEVEAAWQKRLDQWRAERLARKQLLEEVIAGRNQQLQERLAANERQKMENEMERVAILKVIEDNRRWEAEQAAKRMQDNLHYQNDLQEQIHYSNQLKEERRRNEEYEYLMGQQAEREYQEKLKMTLDNPVFERLHPMRRALMNHQ